MKVAFYSFGGCDGCFYELLNLDKDLLNAIQRFGIEIAHSVLLGVPEEDAGYEVALVEGAVASNEDVKKIRGIREKSKILVAMGSCATLSGIPGLRRFTARQGIEKIYSGVELDHKPLDEALPLSRFVKVDYHLRGCPVNKSEFLEILEKIAEGKWLKQGERRFGFSCEKPFSIEGAAITLDGEKCYVCGRCVNVCEKMTRAIDYANRSVDTIISTPFKVKFEESLCISCGQCTLYCPVGAMKEKGSVKDVQRLLKANGDLTAYVEPEVVAALGEAVGIEGNIGGKLVTALQRVGFAKVVLWKPQNNLTKLGDLTIVPTSEAETRFVELFYPDLLPYVADPPKMEARNVVWFTPCVARKLSGNLILTTRELARLINTLEFSLLPVGYFDEILLGKQGEDDILATGIQEVKETLEQIRMKKLKKGTVRLYICPGGCLQGGGQPFAKPKVEVKREKALAKCLNLS